MIQGTGPGVAGATEPDGVSVATETNADEVALERIERSIVEAVARVRESAVALEYPAADGPKGARRVASGVVISGEGDVLSVSVRVDPMRRDGSGIVARDASGRRHRARWVASDPETGLTLLEIAPGLARPATPSTRSARLGLPLLVIGNPFGLGHTVSRGSVSGLDRRLELGANRLGGLIQVDAAIHPGDSGALVADLHGNWLGMIRSGLATATTVGDRDGEGESGVEAVDHRPGSDHDLGFAIPARDALWVAAELKAHQRVDRAYLGVGMSSTASPSPSPEELGPDGALIESVVPETPAARGGLRPGDRIVAIDGRPIQGPNDLTDRLDRALAGTDLVLDVHRVEATRRERLRLEVRTTTRPRSGTPPSEGPLPLPPETTPKPRRSKSERNRPVSAEPIERLERRIDELERRLRQTPSTPH